MKKLFFMMFIASLVGLTIFEVYDILYLGADTPQGLTIVHVFFKILGFSLVMATLTIFFVFLLGFKQLTSDEPNLIQSLPDR